MTGFVDFIADNGKFRQIQRTAARPDDEIFRMPAHILAFLLKKNPARRQGEVFALKTDSLPFP
ncbi:hypothetical protein [Xenorhabdus eapokensis]|uniref:hypothetical protein n=1 Tax=Xenorhabdus eapokensis TaxID=1873482 RepID=UPI001FCA2259|nr:hypothetical protein [Xenorhabdus eapokensis]